MYSSIEQFKNYLGIDSEDTNKDSLLSVFLEASYKTINNYCGVDSFLAQDNEEFIGLEGIYENNYGFYLFLTNKPVNKILELNYEEYSGTKGNDYIVVNDRKIIFNRLPMPKMGVMQIKYNAGYEKAPEDLQLAEMMLASGLYQQHGNEGVSSYKLGDEQIVFGNKANNEGDSDLAYFKVKTILDSKYKTFNLAY